VFADSNRDDAVQNEPLVLHSPVLWEFEAIQGTRCDREQDTCIFESHNTQENQQCTGICTDDCRDGGGKAEEKGRAGIGRSAITDLNIDVFYGDHVGFCGRFLESLSLYPKVRV
jgi:hypothetical protein